MRTSIDYFSFDIIIPLEAGTHGDIQFEVVEEVSKTTISPILQFFLIAFVAIIIVLVTCLLAASLCTCLICNRLADDNEDRHWDENLERANKDVRPVSGATVSKKPLSKRQFDEKVTVKGPKSKRLDFSIWFFLADSFFLLCILQILQIAHSCHSYISQRLFSKSQILNKAYYRELGFRRDPMTVCVKKLHTKKKKLTKFLHDDSPFARCQQQFRRDDPRVALWDQISVFSVTRTDLLSDSCASRCVEIDLDVVPATLELVEATLKALYCPRDVNMLRETNSRKNYRGTTIGFVISEAGPYWKAILFRSVHGANENLCSARSVCGRPHGSSDSAFFQLTVKVYLVAGPPISTVLPHSAVIPRRWSFHIILNCMPPTLWVPVVDGGSWCFLKCRICIHSCQFFFRIINLTMRNSFARSLQNRKGFASFWRQNRFIFLRFAWIKRKIGDVLIFRRSDGNE